MSTIKLTAAKWRELALRHKPRHNFDTVMYDRYGLVRIINREDIFGFYYRITDRAKYTMFVLKHL